MINAALNNKEKKIAENRKKNLTVLAIRDKVVRLATVLFLLRSALKYRPRTNYHSVRE